MVVDDGSDDGTADVLAERGGTDLDLVALSQPVNGGPAAARNRGVAHATGEVVLFLDDDVAAAPDLLAAHLARHEAADDPQLGILGRVDWHPSVRRTAFLRWLDRSGLQFGYDTWLREGPVEPPYAAFYTANVSLRRDLLIDVGGFDERFPYAAYEDMELAFRLSRRGFHLDYRPAAQAFHTRSIDLAGFCARMTRVGESAALLRRAAPEFPLDDAALRSAYARRRKRLGWRALAMVGNATARERWYWSEVAAAYARGAVGGTGGA